MVCSGIYGGMRAAMQLRAMTGELGCISVSNIFGIPEVHKAIDEDGKPLNSHMASGKCSQDETVCKGSGLCVQAMHSLQELKSPPFSVLFLFVC